MASSSSNTPESQRSSCHLSTEWGPSDTGACVYWIICGAGQEEHCSYQPQGGVGPLLLPQFNTESTTSSRIWL